MQLTSIKLSGFKSFVDTTQIRVQGQCVGVVGPNGCGKSNIIDAVRWVLGESRASELRGESMRDVIFSGSVTRKPAGRASVELIFDNSDGRIQGQWGQYAELAVRRVLARDGASTYYINNTAVRRRDVQDIFMGTGLGPRAYAIIGQGMIARIIEARPEELRVFLEEAAGVSKYRERRRDTENRLKETRENLTRVNDILSELTGNMSRLEVQAIQADHYRDCIANRQIYEQTLWLIKQRQAADEVLRHHAAISQANVALESANASITHLQAQLEKLQLDQQTYADAVNVAQGEIYQTNAQIGSIQADIRYLVQTKADLEKQVKFSQTQIEQLSKKAQTLSEEMQTVDSQKQQLLEQSATAQEAVQALIDALPQYEQAYEASQAIVNEKHDSVSQLRQEIATQEALYKSAESVLADLVHRAQRLNQQREQLQRPEKDDESHYTQEIQTLNEQIKQSQSAWTETNQQLTNAQVKLSQVGQDLAQLKREQLQAQTRMATLNELVPNKKIAVSTSLHYVNEKALWQYLKAEDTWATALEVVMGERMHAKQIDDFKTIAKHVRGALQSRQCVFEGMKSGQAIVQTHPIAGLEPLLSKVSCQYGPWQGFLASCLYQVYVAVDIATALEKRHLLPAGAVIVTPEAHIISSDCVRLYAPGGADDGFFKRHQQYETIRQQVVQLTERIAPLQETQKVCNQTVTNLRIDMQNERSKQNTLTQKLHQVQLAQTRDQEKRKQYQVQCQRIDSDLKDIAITREKHQKAFDATKQTLALLREELTQKSEEENASRHTCESDKLTLTSHRKQIEAQRASAQQIANQLQKITESTASLNSQIQTAKTQSEQASASVTQGQIKLQTLDEGPLQEKRDELLALRETQEQEHALQLDALNGVQAQIREKKAEQLRIEQQLQPMRDKIVSLQLKEQASTLMASQYAEKLQDSGLTEEKAQLLDVSLGASRCENMIETLSKEIEAMGDVNLAATRELSEARERQTYLTAQNNDLSEAIETLEGAIKRIDRQTRALLKETFDQVNTSLSELFPMLFGGGHARLEMTGEEILDAGVQIMAQPPGKKNSTIHLLSGGEKALTAIALVFSLFKLNPAPFCLLDEVDAPLDDANTERFCQMVKRMSDNTQFLFISHNRIAMQMAEELVGVTMQERGVSRVVAVDIDRAAEFSEEKVTV